MRPTVSTRLCREQWLWLQTYDFNAGDVLPVHRHLYAAHNHATIVTRGSFIVHGAQEGRVLTSGETVEWPLAEPHGFEAVSTGSQLINARMANMPEMYPDFLNGQEGSLPPMPPALEGLLPTQVET